MPTTRIIKILPLVCLFLFARALAEELPAVIPQGDSFVGDRVEELPIIDRNTNLVMLLEEIRSLVRKGNLKQAQILAQKALSDIDLTEQNKFYLSKNMHFTIGRKINSFKNIFPVRVNKL